MDRRSYISCIIGILMLSSCLSSEPISQKHEEGKLNITKKYIGIYDTTVCLERTLQYPNTCLIYLKDNTILPVYAKDVEFKKGVWLYIQQGTYSLPGNSTGFNYNWVMGLDKKPRYRLRTY